VPTYRIVTLGCKLNQADSSALESALLRLGLSRAPGTAGGASSAPADVVILNTCTVTAGADREARQIARRLRRLNPDALLVATGCSAERDPQSLRRVAGVDHVVGMEGQAARVRGLVAAALEIPLDPLAPLDLGPFGATDACDTIQDRAGRTRAMLKIQDGCNLRCSYCVIPSVRGASRSLPPGDVLRRMDGLFAAGYREIVFTGVNTGDYGRDLDPPSRLHLLLDRALANPGPGRLRLNSLEPKTVVPEIVACFEAGPGRLARHLQIPLQSGSDAILARMRRPYRVSDYARVVESLRLKVPDIGLGADVIVGFPGETDQEFEATFRFIASSPLNYLHVFSFSPRPGTHASVLPDQVPPPIIKERSARLRSLGRALSLRFRSRFLGRSLPVLTLREVRPDGRLRALSDNFIDLGLAIGDARAGAMMNRLLEARICAVTGDDTLASVA
jgi:threonylcarbamoyladenosine tRNA methylthiotransferase MtaB